MRNGILVWAAILAGLSLYAQEDRASIAASSRTPPSRRCPKRS